MLSGLNDTVKIVGTSTGFICPQTKEVNGDSRQKFPRCEKDPGYAQLKYFPGMTFGQ